MVFTPKKLNFELIFIMELKKEKENFII